VAEVVVTEFPHFAGVERDEEALVFHFKAFEHMNELGDGPVRKSLTNIKLLCSKRVFTNGRSGSYGVKKGAHRDAQRTSLRPASRWIRCAPGSGHTAIVRCRQQPRGQVLD
jgi:hypothetical protein